MTINTFRQDTGYNFDLRQVNSAGLNAQKNNTAECKTCAERKYQDKSDDPGVSFKMSGHISGSSSVSVVAGHEREHEARETQKAEQTDGYVVYSRIRINMEQCIECKKIYSSGGETEVVTSGKDPQIWATQINLFNEAQNFIDGNDGTGFLVKMHI